MMTLRTLLIAFLVGGSPIVISQTPTSPLTLTSQVVEASCGTCHFGMKADICTLAIRLPEGKSYWVSGFSIDQFGDAHAADGFCQTTRKAKVSGTLVGDKFMATAFVLIPQNP